jgi:hypothetical protein
MGGPKLFSSSSYDGDTQSIPNAKNFKILSATQVEDSLILLVEYPDCKNYEGKKLLVYENIYFKDLLQQIKTV